MLGRLVFLFALLFAAVTASAQPSPPPSTVPRLSVQVGWGGLHRVSEWTPVYVTLEGFPQDGVPGTVEVWAYQDSRYTLVHHASMPLQSRPTTFILPVTMGSFVEAHSVIVRNQQTGKIIASVGLGDLPPAEVQNIITATRLVAVSGTPTGGIMPGDFLGAFTPIPRLPDNPELYESLDLLTLNADTLESLSTAQATAIARWVRAGGRLLLCLPPEGISPPSPLSEILPATFGPMKMYASQLAGRELLPRDGVTSTALPNGLIGVRQNVGFGWVAILPVPLTPDTRPAAALLVGEIKPRVMLEPPFAPSRVESPWPTVALALLLAGFVLGIVEPVVRRAHNLWPWRWWTLIGVALLASGTLLRFTATPTQPTLTPTTLTDIAGTTIISTAATASPDSGFPRLLVPADLRGTDHLTAQIDLYNQQPRIANPPAATSTLIHRLGPSSPSPTPQLKFQPGAVLISLPPNSPLIDEVLLESSTGIQPARLDPTPPTADAPHTTRWIFDAPLSPTLPESFRQARRLAPLRSGQLQSRITSNEVRVLWTRSGNTFTRTLLLP